jgi:hypothetical protein
MQYLSLLALIPFLFYLLALLFGIYFMVKILRFMNDKTALDKERNVKMDELIRAIKYRNSDGI